MTGEPGARVVEDDLLLALIRKVERIESKLGTIDLRMRAFAMRLASIEQRLDVIQPPTPIERGLRAAQSVAPDPTPLLEALDAEMNRAGFTPVDPDDVRAQAMREEAEAIQAATGGRPDPGGPIPHEDTASWPVHDVTDRGGFRE